MDATEIGTGISNAFKFNYKFDWKGLMETLNLSPIIQFLVSLILSLT